MKTPVHSPPSPQSMRERVRAFFLDQCYVDPEVLEKDEGLFTSGTLSSLDLIDLISFLEEEFSMEIGPQDGEMGNFDSVDLVLDFIMRKRSSG